MTCRSPSDTFSLISVACNRMTDKLPAIVPT